MQSLLRTLGVPIVVATLAVLVVVVWPAGEGSAFKAWELPAPSAYAVVVPGEVSMHTSPVLVASLTRNIVAVSAPRLGVYCLRPAWPVDPGRRPAVVSVEAAYSRAYPGEGMLAYYDVARNECGAGRFEVRTYVVSGAVTRASDGVAFSFLTP
jgi:hypothetical protein